MKISRFLKKSSSKAGMRPGSVVHIGRKKVEKISFSNISYSKSKVVKEDFESVDSALKAKNIGVKWLDVIGLHDSEVIINLCDAYKIHSLIQEDIVNTGQRPILEDYGEHLFFVLKMITFEEDVAAEQVSFVIGKDYLLSFQEQKGDVFNSVRERINTQRWRDRNLGADYLAYALMDTIVDNYFFVIEKLGDKIEHLEMQLNQNPSQELLNEVFNVKKQLLYVRKMVWPLREVVSKFQKSESKLIKKQTKMYVSDLYDHVIQVIDTIESFRDMVSSMIDVHLSMMSNKMNEVMKVLTIFAAIFIPLTFLAGIYGMNFEFMPELGWKYGYFVVWGLFLIVGVGMLVFFRRRKWI